MAVVCVQQKDWLSSHKKPLSVGSIHKIIKVINDAPFGNYVQIAEHPGINLNSSRFEPIDANYNPIIYKIREMSERFEKRRAYCTNLGKNYLIGIGLHQL